MQDWLKRNWKLASLFVLAFAWCSTLVLFRVFWTWNRSYLFLGFNLGLAALPFIFSILVTTSKRTAARLVFGAFWLLFLPNAPYIITDLIHFRALDGAPPWFDILMISSCAGTGLAFGYFSLAQIHGTLLRNNRRFLGAALPVFACFAAAFGIYLGRFLRWRSIDAFYSPLTLLNDIADRFLNPLMHPRTWGFTLGFGTLLLLGYAVLKVGAETLIQNWAEQVRPSPKG